MARNVLEEAYLQGISLIQKYGWFVVIGAIILYFSWPYIEEFQRKRSLAEANNPQRRAVLDAQRLRVRLSQQQSLRKDDRADIGEKID